MRVRDGVLGHVVLNVANLKKSENFYRSIVGMKISARNRRTKMTFMSFGREHHDIALMELARGSKARGWEGDTETTSLLHLCPNERGSGRALPVLSIRKSLSLAALRFWKLRAIAPSVFSTRTATELRSLAMPISLNLIGARNNGSRFQVKQDSEIAPQRRGGEVNEFLVKI